MFNFLRFSTRLNLTAVFWFFNNPFNFLDFWEGQICSFGPFEQLMDFKFIVHGIFFKLQPFNFHTRIWQRIRNDHLMGRFRWLKK